MTFDCTSLKLEKGSSVEVTGMMEQYQPGPPTLRIDSEEHVKLIDRERIPFVELSKGFRTKPIVNDELI